MKAIVYRNYGRPEVLHLEELERPVPRNDEILIKVFAAEATKSDCEMRSFRFAVMWFWLPLRVVFGLLKPKRIVLGAYFSGEVEAVGDDVSDFKKGDQVFGSAGLRLGAYGEYLCLPANSTIVTKPSNITFEQAAAAPLGGLNALHFMRKADIQPGEKVLINGAGASIGTFAVQIAKAMGAEVTAVDSGIKEKMLLQIGAEHFIDYNKQDFTDTGQVYDVLFNLVARSSYSACISALKPKGRYLLANPRITDMLRSIFTNKLSDKKVSSAFAGEKKEELFDLKKMIEDGSIIPVVDKIYEMENAVQAHRRVETEKRVGIVVISIGK